jgi:hypothetical protein
MNRRTNFTFFLSKPKMVLFLLVEYMPMLKCLLSKKLHSQFKTYLNGRKKFFRELDVVELLKSVRTQKILYQSKLHAGQKVLM